MEGISDRDHLKINMVKQYERHFVDRVMFRNVIHDDPQNLNSGSFPET